MPWSANEDARVVAIERALNKLNTAVKNLAPKADLNAYTLIRQREIDALTTRIATLEEQVRLLQRS